MLGWVLSLSLLIVVVQFPFPSSKSEGRVGWNTANTNAEISLSAVQTPGSSSETPPSIEDAPPQTGSRSPEPEGAPPSEAENREQSRSDTRSTDSLLTDTSPPPRSVATLQANDTAPEILGGKGALYLHINYPKTARDKGIEGTMMLEFTVTPDGKAQAVEIVESLHPLCDSAAVDGVKSVQFAPATHNGTPIPVRMRLPIRFRLLSASTTLEPE